MTCRQNTGILKMMQIFPRKNSIWLHTVQARSGAVKISWMHHAAFTSIHNSKPVQIWIPNSVRFVGGRGWSCGGLTSTGDCKVWSGGRIWPHQKGPKSKFVVKTLWTNVRHYSDPSARRELLMTDWTGFTRLIKIWRFDICITVNRQEYHDNVPFPAFDCK